MSDWNQKLARCLELGTFDKDLVSDVKELISWSAGINGADDDFTKSLVEKYGDDGLRERVEEFIDRAVVSDVSLLEMFPASLSEADAKLRYRQLMRIFHPDRGVKDQKWLNYRAEQINKKYETYNNSNVVGETESSLNLNESAVEYNKHVITPARSNVSIKYRPNIWRQRLGNAQTMQRKIIYALFGVSLVLIALFYASSRDLSTLVADDSSTKGLSHLVDVGSGQVQSEALVEKHANGSLFDQLSSEYRDVIDEVVWLDEESPNTFIADDSYQETKDSVVDGVTGGVDALSFVESFGGQEQEREKYEIGEGIENVLTTPSVDAMGASDVVVDQPESTSKDKDVVVPASEIEQHDNTVQEPLVHDGSQGSDLEAVKSEDVPIVVAQEKTNKEPRCTPPEETKLFDQIGKPYLISKKVNFRSSPSISCEILGVLEALIRVQVFECTQDGTWCLVVPKEGSNLNKPGWVNSRYLAQQASLDEASVKKQVVIPDDRSSVKLNQKLVNNIINKYILYFERGDSKGLSGLYIPSGRENRLEGVRQIARYYREAFSLTDQRSLNIEIESFEPLNKSSVLMNGRIYVSKLDKRTKQKDSKEVDFTMLVLKVVDQYKIVEFDWKEKK